MALPILAFRMFHTGWVCVLEAGRIALDAYSNPMLTPRKPGRKFTFSSNCHWAFPSSARRCPRLPIRCFGVVLPDPIPGSELLGDDLLTGWVLLRCSCGFDHFEFLKFNYTD